MEIREINQREAQDRSPKRWPRRGRMSGDCRTCTVRPLPCFGDPLNPISERARPSFLPLAAVLPYPSAI